MRTKTLKSWKKLLATAMTAIMLAVLSMHVSSTPVFAAGIDDGTGITAEDMAAHHAIVEKVSTGAKDGFELVSEFTVQESDDIISTTMIYVKEEITPYSSEWEQKTVEVEKVFTVSLAKTKWVRMIVGGTFRWNGETAKVSGAYGSAEPANKPSSIYITKNPTYTYDSDCGSNFLLGNKYAYVEKRCTATNDMSTNSFKLWLDVNRKGEINTDPSNVDRID